jgi:uncharacterized protein YbgA (DUF1722 family)
MLKNEPTPGGLVPGLPAVAARAGKFHTAHKLTLMAHPGLSVHLCLQPRCRQGRQPRTLPRDGPASLGLRALGTRSVATCAFGPSAGKAGSEPWDEMVPAYGALLMEGLSVLGTRGKHVNARSVQHLRSTASFAVMGYLKNELSAEDKQELLGVIEDYRQGMVPLIVPMTLLKHHLMRSSVPPALPTAGTVV